MDQETIATLLALNREFYTALAGPFGASRPADDPALTPILAHIPQCARVLDVGCGNGRLALLLERERPGSSYVGVDAVPQWIEQARAGRGEHLAASFHVADVTQPGWAGALPPEPFDCAVALAVLHHIPSFELRAQVLRDVAAVLAPAGRLLLSTWQFTSHPRTRRKIVPWAAIDMAEEKLEPGDFLLDWKRGGYGRRYCHLVDEAELLRLAAAAGFQVTETFRAGGREGDLSLGAVLTTRRNPPLML